MLRVNRTLHNVTLQVIYCSCLLDFSPAQKESTVARIESWFKTSSSILPFIRNITLKGSHQPNGDAVDPGKWSCIIQLLSRISRLASLTFDYPEQLPIDLLYALHIYHPSSHLHVRNWTRIAADSPFGDPAEEALANSPCLRSLHGHFITGDSPDADFREEAFNRIAELSPNLEAISRTSRTGGGCIGYFASPEEWRKRAQEAKKFAVETPRRKCVKSLELDSVNASTLKELDSYLVLDRVTSFKCTRLTSDFFFLTSEDPAYRLTSLQVLDVELGNALVTAFCIFLTSCGPLEYLSIVLESSQPWGPILSPILLHHASSIRTLSFHQVESPPTRSMRKCLSLEELSAICQACPELSNLALDIDRTVEKEEESIYYAMLSRFSHLCELTIHMDIGLSHPSPYPRVDEKFALDVWEELSQHPKDGSGMQLRKLVLYIGEQDRRIGRGHPASWVLDEQWRRQWVKVRRNERDDRSREVEVTSSRDWQADIRAAMRAQNRALNSNPISNAKDWVTSIFGS